VDKCPYSDHAHSVPPPGLPASLVNRSQKLSLEDELVLLVLLSLLVCLVVLPADHLFALSAGNVADDVSAGRHIPLTCLARHDVDDIAEEVGFAVLTTEVLADHLVLGSEMGTAVLAAEDLVPRKVRVVHETHASAVVEDLSKVIGTQDTERQNGLGSMLMKLVVRGWSGLGCLLSAGLLPEQ